uniref:SPX domain-containing protein 2-like n=1 Tax=Erigeron canadensis TaxID=72917 RepID=UPI001CB90ADA|nr:SPX domain-containing protein 2-like [Erigeron canadensis]
MKFGKSLRSKISIIMPEWEGQCISYKDLKKQLNLMDPATRDEGFRRLLGKELGKMSGFYLMKENEYNNRLQELKEEAADLFSDEDATDLIRDLQQFHKELVLLLNYNVLNCDGMPFFLSL